MARFGIYPTDEFQMMNDFLQSGPALAPFAMDQIRRDLPAFQSPSQRTPSPSWAAEFDPGEQARMQAAFPAQRMGPIKSKGFDSTDFAHFQQQGRPETQRAASPVARGSSALNGYQRPMGMGYLNGMGTGMGMGIGTGMPNYNAMGMYQQRESRSDAKGKSRMVELDDSNWEAQFAEMENSQQDRDTLSEEANRAIESELDEVDRSVQPEIDHYADFESVWRRIQAERERRQMTADEAEFGNAFSNEDFAAWDNFDSTLGLNPHSNPLERDPQLGDYMFESQNPFLENPTASVSAFDQGVKILQEHGNLSLAALAFEAAVQQEPDHIEAWTQLGSAQAQNEKESPAIRALERALLLDPNNLDALMGLAVSYTNEGYDSTAYRTLERWLSIKYPRIHPPDQVSDATDLGFTDRALLHERVTNLFIRAAQLSPSGEHMDPDVQVGLGVLFYGDEDFEKAVDCFNAALESSETGIVNRQGQVHLLWNRLGATLANSGRSEDAIAAYEKALTVNPNFVRARYNLGVSCINIGCYPEAAQHLLGALSMHRVVEEQGLDKAREIVGDGSGPGSVGSIDDETLERMIQQNESSNLYDTLRRAFTGMKRRDLSEKVGAGMSLDAFRGEFDF
jgi:peroxin-5